MQETYKIGDKIVFIHSKDCGIITKMITNSKFEVEDSSGFLSNVNSFDIIKFNKKTNTVLSFGNIKSDKDSEQKNIKNLKKSNSNVRVIDLHIENINSNFHLLENFEIVQLQLNKCHKALDDALHSSAHKLIIVHGIGEGILKQEVHKILRNYDLRFFISTNGGSTEVML